MARTILVLNVGSSSVKFAVAQGGEIILRGQAELSGARKKISSSSTVRSALSQIQSLLKAEKLTPNVVAHRIVHGGQRYARPTKLTSTVLRYLHQLIELSPLHQPANLLGVDFAKSAWPRATEMGFFDTALYRHLSPSVRQYALPKKLAERLHIEKYGFHGISHRWALTQAAGKLRCPITKLSAVTLHLGSGASMTLWHNGRPIDTTMGFTPLEGLVMSTRSGDIDPAIPLYIQTKLGWSAARVNTMLEEHSGLVGISELKDMRDILSATGHQVPGWPRRAWPATTRAHAQLAIDIYSYHIRRTLAGYLGLLDHPRAIIFTGPVGENITIQKLLLRNLPAAKGIRSLTVPADEEQAIVDAVNA